MAWACIAPGHELADVKADRKQAKRIEAHWMSDAAVYFDGKYLPFSAIKTGHIQPSVYRPNGCCGRGVPVLKLCFDYGGDGYAILMFEKEHNAQAVLDRALAANPAIEVRQYIDPVTGKPPEHVPAAFV